ncbi:hypothetical protein [Paraclostridium bifermentans]|uniref:hypothetical protein n=1 Tax=Paraclostridium bifermentans TaxID=1490 RepID=UPI00374ECBB7
MEYTSSKLKLVWFDKRYRNKYKVNKDLNKEYITNLNTKIKLHYPQLKIIDYDNLTSSYIINCECCGTTFRNYNDIKGYLIGSYPKCEYCCAVSYSAKARKLALKSGMKFIGCFYNYSNYSVRVLMECRACSNQHSFTLRYLEESYNLVRCKSCIRQDKVREFVSLLRRNNHSYLTHYRGPDTTIIVYSCNECDTIYYERADVLKRLDSTIEFNCKHCSPDINEFELNCLNKGLEVMCYYLDGRVKLRHVLTGETLVMFKSNVSDYKPGIYNTKSNVNFENVNTYIDILAYTNKLLEICKSKSICASDLINMTEDTKFMVLIFKYCKVCLDELKVLNDINADVRRILEHNEMYTRIWTEIVPVLEEVLGIEN